MMERWLPVLGYEGMYEVSDEGGVRSLDRSVTTKAGVRNYKGKVLSRLVAGEGGHLAVTLSRVGKYERRLIHHLVLEAFDRPRPDGLFGLHHDDDPEHNELPNLYWGTKRENQLDKVRNGAHHNTGKAHCPQGHEYTEENTRWCSKKNGDRVRRCVTCVRAQALASYYRNK